MKPQSAKHDPGWPVAIIFLIAVYLWGIYGAFLMIAIILFVYGARRYLGWFDK